MLSQVIKPINFNYLNFLLNYWYDIQNNFVGPTFGPSGSVDSAKQNLASSFVNGFVNAAFGRDKLLMEDGQKWLYKNREHGKNNYKYKYTKYLRKINIFKCSIFKFRDVMNSDLAE